MCFSFLKLFLDPFTASETCRKPLPKLLFLHGLHKKIFHTQFKGMKGKIQITAPDYFPSLVETHYMKIQMFFNWFGTKQEKMARIVSKGNGLAWCFVLYCFYKNCDDGEIFTRRIV